MSQKIENNIVNTTTTKDEYSLGLLDHLLLW